MSLKTDFKFNQFKLFVCLHTRKALCMGYIDHCVLGRLMTQEHCVRHQVFKHTPSMDEIIAHFNQNHPKNQLAILQKLQEYKLELDSAPSEKYDVQALPKLNEVIQTLTNIAKLHGLNPNETPGHTCCSNGLMFC